MNKFLSPDNPVMQFITKITNSVYLNILWFLCCLPIITVGAATTALYYVSLKMAENKEGNLTKSFFTAFKENWKKSTKIWLILLLSGLLLACDGYIFYHMRFENTLWTLGTSIFLVALAAYAIVLMYIFPLSARFENTIPAMFKNSLFIGMRFLLCTVLLLLIHVMMAGIVIFLFTPAVIFGEGLCALLSSYLLTGIFKQCETKSQEA